MRCSSCEPVLDRYIEGTLTPRDMIRVRAHLAACAPCASLHTELRVVDALLATGRPVELAPNFTFATMAEARSLEIMRAKRRPIWPVLTAYVVTAWVVLAVCFVVFGSHIALLDAVFGSAVSQIRTTLAVVSRSFGSSALSVIAGVIVVLAVDAAIASGAFYLYRRARSRAMRSEAS
jgi:anti-sigma factor RsiW